MYIITKEFHFESAHCLNFSKGKCDNLHGHSYKLFVSVGCEKLDENGIIIDFADIKKIVEDAIISEFDHACILNKNSKNKFEIELQKLLIKHNKKTILLEVNPTAEEMAKIFYGIISLLLDKNHKLIEVKLYETAENMATFNG